MGVRTSLWAVAVVVGWLGPAGAVPVDNGVQGQPEIQCGPTAIELAFNTENEFEGSVYVKVRLPAPLPAKSREPRSMHRACRTTRTAGARTGAAG